MGMPRAVIFDLDWTLTDRTATVHAYARALARDFADRLTTSDHDVIVSEVLRVDDNGYNFHRADDLAVSSLWSHSPGAQALGEHWHEAFTDSTVGREGFDTVPRRLREAGMALGLITNGFADRQRRKLEVLGLSELLDAVCISGELGIEKPDPRIFHSATEALGLAPSECAYVGDHPAKDVQGALDAGLQAVWMRAALPWPAELAPPPHAIDALPELLALEW